MPLEVHVHERAELHEPGVDRAQRARVARRDDRDQVALEPLDRLRGRERVDRGRADPAVDRAGHQGQAARHRRVAVLGHQRGGGERRDARLADRHQVRARPHRLEEGHDVLDVLVEAEPPGGERHVARVVPVGDEDVVVGEHRLNGVAQQGREVPRHGREQEHARLHRLDVLPEVQQRPERRAMEDLLAHRDVLAADPGRGDVEGGALVGQVGEREHLDRGGGPAHRQPVVERLAHLLEGRQRRRGRRPGRPHQVRVRLKGLVEHRGSSLVRGSLDRTRKARASLRLARPLRRSRSKNPGRNAPWAGRP